MSHPSIYPYFAVKLQVGIRDRLKPLPVYVESSILELPKIWINGGKRGFLVGIDPKVLTAELGAQPVQCALPP